MSSPEEQKSRLQAARLRMRFKKDPLPEANRNAFEVTDSTQTQVDQNSSSTEAKRRTAFLSNRNQAQVLTQQRQPSSNRTPEPNPNSQITNTNPQNRLREDRTRSRIKRTENQQKSAQKNTSQPGSGSLQNELKKKAKATFRRGAIYIVDLLAGALDLSSAGVTFVVDVMVYFFTLGWLNLELFYGTYFSKKKSRLVSPLSWDPIPMPVDKDAFILQTFVIAADLLLAIAFIMFLFGGVCLMHDYVMITTNLLEVAKMGADIATGGDGGLCLGGILLPVFGF